MKKLLCLAFLALLVGGAVFAQFARNSTAWVSVRTINLKSSTGIFASNRGALAYGDEVRVLQVSGSWAEVRSSNNLTGWIKTANLSSRRITSTGGTSSASASEVALAGKGFDRDVENAYKAGGNLNYTDVDRTEELVVSDDDLYRFITEGRLSEGAD